MLHFHFISIFPELIENYLAVSILGRAADRRLVKWHYHQLLADDSRQRLDDRPYGGGPGMVVRAEPVLAVAEKIRRQARKQAVKFFVFSPGGKQFDNRWAEKLSQSQAGSHLVFICGRYEGLDARVRKILRAQELSIGPYVLTGGEVPAMVVADAIVRRLPGVLGKAESVEERRQASHDVYTRPEVLVVKTTAGAKKKYSVPKVLLSGNHAEIDAWRQRQRRPTV